MPPINSALIPGTTMDDKDWTSRVGTLRSLFGQISGIFANGGYTLVMPPSGLSVAFGPYVFQIVQNGADMIAVAPSLFNLPADAPAQLRDLAERTRRAGEIKVWVDQAQAETTAAYQSLIGQLCLAAGVIVAQVRSVDGTPLLSSEMRQAIDEIKGPVLTIYNNNNAGIQQNRQHNQQLIAQGEQKAAAVKAELQVTQAENTVLRGSSLGKDVLQAPPAPKKAGRAKAPVHKTGKPPTPHKTGTPHKPGKAVPKKGA